MKNILKDLIFFVLHIFSPPLGIKASILMYHSVGENDAFFTVTPKNFEKQLAHLKENVKEKNYRCVKLSELVRAKKNDENIGGMVTLTFDDGYGDNYTNAFPLLKKYNIPATIFLITEEEETDKGGVRHAECTWDMLSQEQIQEMEESGLVEFAPHTAHHKRLSELSEEEWKQEIDASKEALPHATVFSYPYGMYSEAIVEYVGEQFEGAVSVKEGLVSKNSDLHLLPRNSIDASTSFIQFKGKVSGAIELYQKLKP